MYLGVNRKGRDKMSGNPYSIGFGRIHTRFISRDILIDEIIDNINIDEIQGQAYKLTGIRGSGKTVTLTAIEKKVKVDDRWIVIPVKPESKITEELVGGIYNRVPLLSSFFSTSLNLSKFGIGLNISGVNPVSSIDAALEKIMAELKKKGLRLLVTIDEVKNSEYMRDFIQEFQLLIRQDMPIYLIIAGLYNDIESLENADHLTFLLRAERYEMKPLNYTIIKADYEKTLGVSREVAECMAAMTGGYAFAYQALGKYMWESGRKEISDEVVEKLDEALAEKVYEKIWSELSPRERWYMGFIVKKDSMPVSELLEITGKKKNEFSVPRHMLIKKGVIDASKRGVISVKLPRFREFVDRQLYYEGEAGYT
ncbi:MAG: hypothetical protein J6X66_07370 [Lachnospiraceae bacterium]|nr:hypothetical protein [Lachnospiraceae bacterium]